MRSRAEKIWAIPSSYVAACSAENGASSRRSLPAQNALPSPRVMIALTSERFSNSCIRAKNKFASSWLMAFKTAGRCRVSQAIPSLTWRSSIRLAFLGVRSLQELGNRSCHVTLDASAGNHLDFVARLDCDQHPLAVDLNHLGSGAYLHTHGSGGKMLDIDLGPQRTLLRFQGRYDDLMCERIQEPHDSGSRKNGNSRIAEVLRTVFRTSYPLDFHSATFHQLFFL